MRAPEPIRATRREHSRGDQGGIKGGSYYGYEDYLYGKVVENFARHGVPVQQNNVHLVKGLFEDTLKIEGPVALAHIDGV